MRGRSEVSESASLNSSHAARQGEVGAVREMPRGASLEALDKVCRAVTIYKSLVRVLTTRSLGANQPPVVARHGIAT